MLLGASELVHTHGRYGWNLINFAGISVAVWISVLTHELCHALAARLVGLRVHGVVWGNGPVLFRGVFWGVPYRIHFFLWSGMTHSEIRDGRWFRLRRLVVVLAGPMSHLVMLFMVVFLFLDRFQNENFMNGFAPLSSFIFANLILFFVNLLPHVSQATRMPSDGKQALTLLSRNGKQSYREWEGRGGLTEASLYMEARKWAAAEEAIRPLLQRYPSDWMVGMISCTISSHMRLHEESLAKARQLLQLKPPIPGHEAWVLNSIAWSHIAIGDPAFANEALENSRAAYEAYPWEPSCLSNWGHSQALYGDPNLAIELLTDKRMRLNNPGDKAIVACALSHARARLGMLTEARQGIRRAADLDASCEFLERTEAFIRSCEAVNAASNCASL